MNVFPTSDEMGIGEAGITAIFGYAVVFVGLFILMVVLHIMGAIFKAREKKETAANSGVQSGSVSAIPDAQVESVPLAPGSAGHVKLYDVPDKEAAMVMAVVAHKMQRPLNELHFISIKEVKSDEV